MKGGFTNFSLLILSWLFVRTLLAIQFRLCKLFSYYDHCKFEFVTANLKSEFVTLFTMSLFYIFQYNFMLFRFSKLSEFVIPSPFHAKFKRKNASFFVYIYMIM